MSTPPPRATALPAPPALAPLLARGALLSPFKRPRPDADCPRTRLVLPHLRIDPARLTAYERVCGFATGEDTLPVTYPHVLAFPLAMRLMSDRHFPLPLLGLVHTSIDITRHRPLPVAARYELTVHVDGLTPHRRGTEATVVTEMRDGGELVWESRSRYLARHRVRTAGAGGLAGPGDGGGEGAAGAACAPGAADAAGAAGTPGEPGTAGATGAACAAGAAREPGAAGAAGASGAAREPGAAGATGAAGAAGAPREPGLAGAAGAAGAWGAALEPGAAGAAGAAGVASAPREPGAAGVTGAAGTAGTADTVDVLGPLPLLDAWRLAGDVGRRYGGVSGDRNPIHLHPLTARLFGFPRAIAHGMWTAARCLAAHGTPQAVRVRVDFRAPVLLPGTVSFAADGSRFELRGAGEGGRLHVSGRVDPLV